MSKTSLRNLQHADLRRRLQLQRLILAQQLHPATVITPAYPRSITMRLLQGQPGLAFWLLTELAPPLLKYFVAARQGHRYGTWIKAQDNGNTK